MSGSRRPYPKEMVEPWITMDCDCGTYLPGAMEGGCDKCDGHGWFYFNRSTARIVSEMMLSAMERHG